MLIVRQTPSTRHSELAAYEVRYVAFEPVTTRTKLVRFKHEHIGNKETIEHQSNLFIRFVLPSTGLYRPSKEKVETVDGRVCVAPFERGCRFCAWIQWVVVYCLQVLCVDGRVCGSF